AGTILCLSQTTASSKLMRCSTRAKIMSSTSALTCVGADEGDASVFTCRCGQNRTSGGDRKRRLFHARAYRLRYRRHHRSRRSQRRCMARGNGPAAQPQCVFRGLCPRHVGNEPGGPALRLPPCRVIAGLGHSGGKLSCHCLQSSDADASRKGERMPKNVILRCKRSEPRRMQAPAPRPRPSRLSAARRAPQGEEFGRLAFPLPPDDIEAREVGGG